MSKTVWAYCLPCLKRWRTKPTKRLGACASCPCCGRLLGYNTPRIVAGIMTRARRRLIGEKSDRSAYEQYLQSRLWRQIRSRVLKRDDDKCVACRKPADQVHHRSYESAVLAGNDDSKLTSVCQGCHRQIEYDNGVKNTLRRANEKLDAMLGAAPRTATEG